MFFNQVCGHWPRDWEPKADVVNNNDGALQCSPRGPDKVPIYLLDGVTQYALPSDSQYTPSRQFATPQSVSDAMIHNPKTNNKRQKKYEETSSGTRR